jgi:beta-glucanase (GH16 family)
MTTRHPRARIRAHFAIAALAISLLAACTDDDTPDGDEQLSGPVVLATESTVTLRTRLQNRYIAAQNNGGGAVTAVATVPQAWETFTLVDENNGALDSGDIVGLRAGNGQFVQAVNGGGGAVNATGAALLDWERFRIFKQGGGQVRSGDTIALQTIVSGRWLSAENGGGSTVSASGPAYDTWEQLVITLGGAPPPPPPPPSWRLVWQDEFDGPTIDESKWVYEVRGPGWVNNELQNYTNRRWENARIENGALVIEARRDFFGGEYSSARLKTAGRASWTYGRVEARLQVPTGYGTWPAFWMMPDNQSRGWPACGEIDVMEHVGYDENRIHSTTHSLRYNWRSPSQRTASTFVPGATGGFHVYAVEWYPDRIEAFVDGVRYFTSPNDGGGDDSWPFNKNFHIILNLAVGGDWGGARGVDPNIWPKRMTVDYVRVYQR